MRTELRVKRAGTTEVQGALWSARASDWAEIQEGMSYPLFVSALVKADIEPGMSHLDVGCGAGRASNLSAIMGATVTGIDASSAMIAIARQRTPHGEFYVAEMEDLPFADASFDLVTGFNAFQFASDTFTALK